MNIAVITTHAPRLPHLRPALDAVCAQECIGRVLLLVADELEQDTQRIANGTRAELHTVEDIGPGKKHLGSLFCDPSDLVITFDDDFCYVPEHATPLILGVRHSLSVCGYCGYDLAANTVTEGPAVFLNGATSWAYLAGWVDPAQVMRWGRDTDCWHSDDIYMGRVFKDAERSVQVVLGEKQNLYPPPNRAAWFVRESLAYHPARLERSMACQRRVSLEPTEARAVHAMV